jgi:hypothetical protein
MVATGARYSATGHSNHRDAEIPGFDQSFVYRPEDILLGKNSCPSGKIVLLDGEGLHTGVGIAEAVAIQGSDVEYLTPHFSPVSPRVASSFEVPGIMKRRISKISAITRSQFTTSIPEKSVPLRMLMP